MSHATTLSVGPKKGFRFSSETSPGGQKGNSGRAGKIFTMELQAKFLRKYVKYRSVERAARATGFSASTIYNQIDRSTRFEAEFEKARSKVIRGLECKLIAFATGDEMPVHNSQLTAVFGVLRAFKPERYRENIKVGVSAEGDFAAFIQGMNSALAAHAAAKALPLSAEAASPALEHRE